MLARKRSPAEFVSVLRGSISETLNCVPDGIRSFALVKPTVAFAAGVVVVLTRASASAASTPASAALDASVGGLNVGLGRLHAGIGIRGVDTSVRGLEPCIRGGLFRTLRCTSESSKQQSRYRDEP
jgi:hypothetical protein